MAGSKPVLVRMAGRIQRDIRKVFRLWNMRRKGMSYLSPNFLYFQRFSANSTIIDVGCSHEADLSVFLIDTFGLNAYGVDPTRKHSPSLTSLSAKKNGHFHYFQLAVCSTDGSVTFHESRENESGSIRSDHTNVANDTITSYTVEAVTPTTLISRVGAPEIDLLKLDIEGAEYDLLQGIDLKSLRPCRQIFVEFHHHAVDAYSEKDTQDIVDRFKRAGYNAYSLDDHNYLFDRI